jgi:hypothetical protein
MAEQLFLLVTGFVLTTVLGGVLGYYFQNRAWNHQHKVERHDERRRRALGVFEELSTLMDRRIYRMRQVVWASRGAVAKGEPTDDLRAARDEYRVVLRDWNDNLNRSLALAQASFGEGIRSSLESDLYERFSSIGRALDDHLRRVSSGQGTREDAAALGRRITRLARAVYDLDVVMLRRIHDDQLDEDALRTSETPARDAARPVLELGDQGSAVRRLQDALRRAGHGDLAVDSDFGRATHDAVRAFQAAQGLDADGIVGPHTWDALANRP